MAIAFDAFSNGTYNSGGNSTIAFTCTGANRFLVVNVLGDTTDTTTGVTYAGVSMTLVTKVAPSGSNTNWNYIFILIAPASGTNNVIVTTTNQTITSIKSFTGCNQTTQPDASATQTGAYVANSNLALSVTSTVTSCWISASIISSNGAWTSNNANTLIRGNDAFHLLCDADSNASRSVGSNALNIINTNSNSFSAIIISIKPLTGTAFTSSYSDTLSLVEIISKSIIRNLNETYTLSDSIVRRINRPFSETFSIIETFSKRTGKTLAETISFVDVFHKSTRVSKSEIFDLLENINLNPTIQNWTYLRNALGDVLPVKQTGSASEESATYDDLQFMKDFLQ